MKERHQDIKAVLDNGVAKLFEVPDADKSKSMQYSIISLDPLSANSSDQTVNSAFKFKRFKGAASYAEAKQTYLDAKNIVENDTAMLLTVNGHMALHRGSEDETNAMIGKAIQKGELKYDGATGNMLINEYGTSMVQTKAKK